MNNLCVLRFSEGWKIVSGESRWGCFPEREAAEEAALRLAITASAGGKPRPTVLVQDAVGELTELAQLSR